MTKRSDQNAARLYDRSVTAPYVSRPQWSNQERRLPYLEARVTRSLMSELPKQPSCCHSDGPAFTGFVTGSGDVPRLSREIRKSKSSKPWS